MLSERHLAMEQLSVIDAVLAEFSLQIAELGIVRKSYLEIASSVTANGLDRNEDARS